MASVLIGIDDPQVARELGDALEAVGHHTTLVNALETTPAPGRPTPDVLVVDGDSPEMDMAVVAAAWRRREPPPGMVVLGSTQSARGQAERVHARLVAKPVETDKLVAEVQRLLHGAQADESLTPEEALRALGLVAGGLAEDQAAMILTGSRTVDVTLVREALRPHMYDYVVATVLLQRLLHRRVFNSEEAKLAMTMDGGRTVRGVVDGLPRAADDLTPLGALSSHRAARVVWALTAGGAAVLAREPPPGHPTARLRAQVRARKPAYAQLSHYQVLELGIDASAADIQRASDLAEQRYGPEAQAAHDLGDLTGAAAQVWEQIARARIVLSDARLRADYDAALVPRHSELEELRQRRRMDGEESEKAFLRGQQALAAGDVYRAVSELAGAARRFPGHPDYEAYAAWARFLGEEAHDLPPAERRKAAERERLLAEAALRGRRPWPRALCALGLLSEAAGDLAGAAAAFREALAGDEKLAAARVGLARLRA